MKHFIKTAILLLLAIAVLPSAYAQTDSDGDGMNDDVDACPFENGEGDRNEFGCLDDDHDGVEDWFDNCPNSVDLANRPVGPDGCWDQDGDGLTGDDDLCSNSPLPVNSLGCWDEDQDGFAYDPNYVNQISPRDNCPTEYSTTNNGCPDPNATTTDTTNTDTTNTDTTNTDTTTTDTTTTDTTTTDDTTGTHVGLPATTSLPATFEACSNSGYMTPRLEVDGLGTLVTDNNSIPLNFRASASTDSGVISVIREDEVFLVLDGPICSQNPNYRWWNVYFDGRSGWIVESTSSDYLARPFTLNNNEELPDNAIIIVGDLTEVTDNGRTFYRYIYETTLEPGTIVRVFMSVPNQHTYIYADIVNEATGITDVLEDSTNDDDSTNDLKNVEFTVRELAEYSVYGKSDLDGKFIVVIVPPADAPTSGRGGEQSSDSSTSGRGGEQSSDSSTSGRGGEQSSDSTTSGRGGEQSSDSNSSAQAAAAAAGRNTRSCDNVAQDIYIFGDSFFSPNGELLDSNANTGWSTRSIEDAWFGVDLNGSQTISSIEFNGYSWTGNPQNSVKDFDVTYYDLVNDEFVDILLETADMEQGYATYNFEPVTVETLVIFLVSNHGGTAYEVTDIRVCAD